MEWVEPDSEGRVSLGDYLRCGCPFPPDRTVEWAIQFCLGMEHANACGLCSHGDIKPTNILISHGVLKITDFGLATAAQAASDKAAWEPSGGPTPILGMGFSFNMVRTKTGMRRGTPGYMPPEVFRCESADVRSDIYAFGLVLWQMATGSPLPPFVKVFHRDIESFTRAVYDEQMKGQVPRVSGPMGSVIDRCLNAVPAGRFSSFGDLRIALETIFRKLTERPPPLPATFMPTAPYWINKGVSLHALGRQEDAIVCYDKAISVEPQSAKAWNNKGNSLVGLGRYEEALAAFDKALEIDSQMATAWGNKGNALAPLGRLDEAIRCFGAALAIDPQYTMAWINRANALDAIGQHEQAIESYDKALAIDPRDPTAWGNKGIALHALRRYDDAVTCFERALAIDPREAIVWFSKGNSFDAQGRTDKAIACFDQALAIDPLYTAACFNKACAEEAIGDRTAAFHSYNKFLELAPSQDARQIAHARERIQKLSSGHREDEDPEKRVAVFREALSRDPQDGSAINALVQALADAGKLEEAISTTQRLQGITGWEIIGACKEAQLLAATGQGMAAYLLLNKWLSRHQRSAMLWFSMAVILRPASQYRQQALTAAQNALLCYRENPKQLTRDNYQFLEAMIAELSGKR
jgi:tetratricopeptide (TPR) repeat protein